MANILPKKEFLKTIEKEELFDLWTEQNERRIKAEDDVRRLKNNNKSLHLENEKLQRFLNEKRAEVERINRLSHKS